jgi:hypothetical protein
MAFLPSPKYDKLPKWVREDIESLQRYVKKLEKEKEVLLNSHPKSDTVVRLDYPEVVYFPNGSRVEFTVPDLTVQVHTDMEGRVRITFDDGVIVPSGRNCIHILPNKNPKGY